MTCSADWLTGAGWIDGGDWGCVGTVEVLRPLDCVWASVGVVYIKESYSIFLTFDGLQRKLLDNEDD